MPSTRAQSVVAVGLAVKPVGKPDAGNPHVWFDERGRGNGAMPPRPSSTLQVKGRKRHVAVDTLGLPIKCQVTTADVQDRAALPDLLKAVKAKSPWVELAFVDGGYADDKTQRAPALRGQRDQADRRQTQRPRGQRIYRAAETLDRRTTFGWVNRARRLAKDFETSITSSQNLVHAIAGFLARSQDRQGLQDGGVISSQALSLRRPLAMAPASRQAPRDRAPFGTVSSHQHGRHLVEYCGLRGCLIADRDGVLIRPAPTAGCFWD